MRAVRHRLTRSAAGAGGGVNHPVFWAPLADSGAGAVNTTASAGGAATFTRATTAWTKLSTGLWVSVASGTARSCYLGATTAVGAYGGYLAEEARTNQCLQSRDMTNASWTKVTMTAAKDQAGIDGVASSASSLTASAGAASCLQTITEAATTSAFSCFIKRITGTGTVTIQQGASTLEVSGSINSSTYTRVEIDASVLNPIIGIALGTNGDKIAVDMAQFENGSFATSPIPTTTTSQTRNFDQLSYPLTGIQNTIGTAYCQFSKGTQGYTGNGRLIASTGASNNGLFTNATPNINLFDGTNTVSLTVTSGATDKLVGTWGGTTINVYANGIAGATMTFDGDLGLVTALEIGGSGGASNSIDGCIQQVKVYPRVLTTQQIIGM